MTERPILWQYFSQFKPVHFKKGEILERPGLLSLGVFFIETGCVKKYLLNDFEEEKIVKLYKSDQIFPLVNIFQNSERYLYAEAIEDTSVRTIDENSFKKFLKENPKAMWEFNEYVLEQLNIFSKRIENLSFMTSYPRVIFRLLSLVEKFGRVENNKVILEIPMTQKDIASTIAMAQDTVGRELKKLNKEGIVGYKNKILTINNLQMLIKKMDVYQEIEWHLDKFISRD